VSAEVPALMYPQLEHSQIIDDRKAGWARDIVAAEKILDTTQTSDGDCRAGHKDS
jgi:hypothetical protein